jgi:hypothetical protein
VESDVKRTARDTGPLWERDFERLDCSADYVAESLIVSNLQLNRRTFLPTHLRDGERSLMERKTAISD